MMHMRAISARLSMSSLRLQALQVRRQWVVRLQRHCGIDGGSAAGVRRYISGGRRQQRFCEGPHRVVSSLSAQWYGHESWGRRAARQRVIVEQQREIAEMQQWL